MTIVIDDNAGPCPGVQRALRLLERELGRSGGAVALGEVIHNPAEVQRLEGIGLKTVPQERIEEKGAAELGGRRVFIRAHGIADDLRRRLFDAGAEVIDGTCPTVRRLQETLSGFAERGLQVLIVGKPGHPEVKGLVGACGGRAQVIADEADIDKVDLSRETVLAAQTTMSPQKLERIAELLSAKMERLTVLNTLCPQVTRREENVRNFAARVTVVLLVGGKNSSNTKVLYQTALSVNPRTYWIETVEELEAAWFSENDVVGITGSASTPTYQLREVRDALEALFARGFSKTEVKIPH